MKIQERPVKLDGRMLRPGENVIVLSRATWAGKESFAARSRMEDSWSRCDLEHIPRRSSDSKPTKWKGNQMQHQGQNSQIELLGKLALGGGGYSWGSTPISDSEAEDPSFYISQPEEPLRRAMLASARRRDSLLLSEAHLPTKENVKAGPRNPYRVPAGVVPYEPGEGLSLENPRPDRFENIAGSGEGEDEITGEDAKLLDKLSRMSDLEIFDMLDHMSRKSKKRKRTPGQQRQDAHGCGMGEGARPESVDAGGR